MKKITLLLLLLTISFQGFAQDQLLPAGFYRLQVLGDFTADNVVVTPNRPGVTSQQAINLLPLDLLDSNQVFELIYTGETFTTSTGQVQAVFNLVSFSGSGNIEAANSAVDGVRELTRTSTRSNIRGGTTEGNEAGVHDDFYLQSVISDDGEPAFRIRIAHDQTPDGNTNLRLVGATSRTEDLFLNVGGSNGSGRDQFNFIEDTTLSTPSVSSSDFFVSNPVNDVLTINGLTSNIKSVSVYNILGNQVSTVGANGPSTSINTSSYAAGLYIVKIVSDNGTFSTKVVKE